MGVLGKDLLDFHRPRTNTKVEFGVLHRLQDHMQVHDPKLFL